VAHAVMTMTMMTVEGKRTTMMMVAEVVRFDRYEIV
jgi:hypothetical protein